MTDNSELIARAKSFTAGQAASGLVSQLAVALEVAEDKYETEQQFYNEAEEQCGRLIEKIDRLQAQIDAARSIVVDHQACECSAAEDIDAILSTTEEES